MKLIGTYESPFVRRVAAALISLSMDFRHEDLHGYREPARARAFNPVGKVPVLVLDDGEKLIDSAAILDHLDEIAGPERALTPHGGAERRHVLQLSAIAATICEQSTLRYFEEHRPDGYSDRDLVDRYRSQAIGGFKALEAAAAEGRFLAAATLNQADITAVIAFQYARPIHPDIDLDATAPALSQLVGRLAATPPSPARVRRPEEGRLHPADDLDLDPMEHTDDTSRLPDHGCRRCHGFGTRQTVYARWVRRRYDCAQTQPP